MFAKEKPSALYLAGQSEIRGRIPLEKRREANAVREQSGGEQWACQVAGHADDLQPSGGGGRVRHRPTSAKLGELVPEKVNGV